MQRKLLSEFLSPLLSDNNPPSSTKPNAVFPAIPPLLLPSQKTDEDWTNAEGFLRQIS